MGLLDHLETQLRRQIDQLQTALQQVLDDYQPFCGQCRRMAGGITLLGAEMRRQRFSKKNRDTAISLAARLMELRPRRKPGGLRQEYGRPVAAEDGRL